MENENNINFTKHMQVLYTETVKHNERRLYELKNLNYSNLSEP